MPWLPYLRERAAFTHWIGDWVGPKSRLVAVVKRKILSFLLPGIKPQSSSL
jgi:hypothetical protein